MRRYRLTENRLRNIIREAIKEQFGRTKDNNWAKMAHRPKTNESKIRGMIREAISDILLSCFLV